MNTDFNSVIMAPQVSYDDMVINLSANDSYNSVCGKKS